MAPFTSPSSTLFVRIISGLINNLISHVNRFEDKITGQLERLEDKFDRLDDKVDNLASGIRTLETTLTDKFTRIEL